MLVDNRSEYMYPKGVFGYRIVEAIAGKKIYDADKKEIYLTLMGKEEKYGFILSFDDLNFFREIKNEIYNNRSLTIVVAGNWSSCGIYNKFKTKLTSKAQIYLNR